MGETSSNLRFVVARNIRDYRLKLKLSQEQLADVCGFHRTYVGSVERGERNITLSTLETFANAFEVNVTALLVEDSVSKDS